MKAVKKEESKWTKQSVNWLSEEFKVGWRCKGTHFSVRLSESQGENVCRYKFHVSENGTVVCNCLTLHFWAIFF